ncbi:MAG: hypothetical protein ACFB21_16055 [Opitutales bacterium]
MTRSKRSVWPKGVAGREVWVKVGSPAPADASELHFLGTDTRTPYLAEYHGEDANQIALDWLRWVNTRGEHGPRSECVEATVQG